MTDNFRSFKSKSATFFFSITIAGLVICLSSVASHARKKAPQTGSIGVKFFGKKFADHATVYASSDNVLEATINITSKLKNMRCDRGSPALLRLNLVPGKPLTLVNYFPIIRNGKWGYRYHYDAAIGHLGGKPDLNHPYSLPYKKNKTYKVSQGANGKRTHHFDHNRFAIDFKMPIGTTICSARPGRVIAIKQDSNVHGSTEEYKKKGNRIIIKHSDGTYGLYYHLKKNGSLVKLGSSVYAGQPIALSGNTGFTNGPHLHFCVSNVIMKKGKLVMLSIPVKFNTARGINGNLRKRENYYHPGARIKKRTSSKASSIH